MASDFLNSPVATLLMRTSVTSRTDNPFTQLYQQAKADASREYHGRGILVQRCSICQLKPSHCICHEVVESDCPVDFVLIFHRDEIFKPTNTGKLIAQQFPRNTHAFLWHRVTPPQALLDILRSPERDCYIVFPGEASDARAITSTIQKTSDKRTTLILLDATWRQSRRMFNASDWLKDIPCLKLNPESKAVYSTRSAAHDHYLSTAESAALALAACQSPDAAQTLFNTFALFDSRYAKMKQNIDCR